jgi:FkbM family methyltransferase
MELKEKFDEIKQHLVAIKSRIGDIAVYKNDNIISLAISLFGEYAHVEILIMAGYITPGSTYLDIGTNIGYHAVGMYKQTGCKVIGFEPNPNHFVVAAYNCQEYPIQIMNTALGSKKGKMMMTDFDINKQSNFGDIHKSDEGTLEVSVSKVDDFKFTDVSVMKVDVEGAELEVFKGAKKTIDKQKPAIFYEANQLEWLDCFDFLEKLGYKQYWVGVRNKPEHATFFETEENPFGESGVTNILAIHESKEQPKILVPVIRGESYNDCSQRIFHYKLLF